MVSMINDQDNVTREPWWGAMPPGLATEPEFIGKVRIGTGDQAHLYGADPDGDPNTYMPDVWAYLVIKYGIKRVVDVGCGLGHNAKWFLDYGLEVLGIDGTPDYVTGSILPSDQVMLCDYTHQTTTDLPEFDLCICSEFVEHVEARFIPNFLATFRACKYVLMTHGEPGQPGVHHVNCETTQYWIDVMAQAGFVYCANETARLRATDRGEPYGRRTLTFFVRNATTKQEPIPNPVIQLVTDFPLATDSPDHTHPAGTARDNHSCIEFVEQVEEYLPKRPLRCLDLGCAGGQAAVDFRLRGHISLGLEGSDYGRKNQTGNWPEYDGTVLHTCDVSKPFTIQEDADTMQFDVITAWELIEHLKESDLPQFWSNVANHLSPDGIFIGTINLEPWADPTTGLNVHHQTVKPFDWWVRQLTSWFEPVMTPITRFVREDAPHCVRFTVRKVGVRT